MGLNESGKTTVLEAINFFNQSEETLEGLYDESYQVGDIHNLIPIYARANFNERIVIRATLVLDEHDIEGISKFCKSEFDFRVDEISRELVISRTLEFENSVNERGFTGWALEIDGKPRRAQKNRKFNILKAEALPLRQFITSQLPSILYFPDFAFEIPPKIYLEEREGLSKANDYYKLIVQDILDSLDDDLEIQTHIVDRARSPLSYYRDHLQSVLQKMSYKITADVIDAWENIFGKKLGSKRIIVRSGVDDGEGG